MSSRIFVPAAKAQPTHAELRNSSQVACRNTWFPQYCEAGALPLNPNGKVDRAALPAPNTDNTLRDGTFVAPRSPVEERLATMLASLLHLDESAGTITFFYSAATPCSARN